MATRNYEEGEDLDVACAIRLTPAGEARLAAAAGTQLSEWNALEWGEPFLREACRQLTGQALEEVITEGDVISRRPFLCAKCGGTFTVAEYESIKGAAGRRRTPDPFWVDEARHRHCAP